MLKANHPTRQQRLLATFVGSFFLLSCSLDRDDSQVEREDCRDAASPGSALLQLSQQRHPLQRNHEGGTAVTNSSKLKLSLSQSSMHRMCSRVWRGATERRDCALQCRAPEVMVGLSSNGGKELDGGTCGHFASRLIDGQRYCGEGPEYFEGSSLDCRGCFDCPPLCRTPEIATGSFSNGGKDLENGACIHFASKLIDGQRYCGEGPDYMDGDTFDCRSCRSSGGPEPGSKTFHDIVGEDGVYMISLNCRTERFEFSAGRLLEVGIKPSFFPATEASAPATQLDQGCIAQAENPPDGQCYSMAKVGWGCGTVLEQAIADSHKRALEQAQGRSAEWTAILEDDAVPAMTENGQWTENLIEVWKHISADIDVVRLGWCGERDPTYRWTAGQNTFVLADTPITAEDASWAGGCTHAYVVRRSAIPKMLALFPCCCAVDCCMAWGMTNLNIKMVNVDAFGSKDYIAKNGGRDWGNGYGVVMQAKHDLPSVRGAER